VTGLGVFTQMNSSIRLANTDLNGHFAGPNWIKQHAAGARTWLLLSPVRAAFSCLIEKMILHRGGFAQPVVFFVGAKRRESACSERLMTDFPQKNNCLEF